MATTTNQTILTQVGNEVIELKGDELKELLQTKKEMQDEIAAEKALVEAKAAQRQLLLDRLGITAEEAQLLLGSN